MGSPQNLSGRRSVCVCVCICFCVCICVCVRACFLRELCWWFSKGSLKGNSVWGSPQNEQMVVWVVLRGFPICPENPGFSPVPPERRKGWRKGKQGYGRFRGHHLFVVLEDSFGGSPRHCSEPMSALGFHLLQCSHLNHETLPAPDKCFFSHVETHKYYPKSSGGGVLVLSAVLVEGIKPNSIKKHEDPK